MVHVAQELEKDMIVQDEIAKKGFVSVDNIWVVDRLRDQVAEMGETIAEERKKSAALKQRLGID